MLACSARSSDIVEEEEKQLRASIMPGDEYLLPANAMVYAKSGIASNDEARVRNPLTPALHIRIGVL